MTDEKKPFIDLHPSKYSSDRNRYDSVETIIELLVAVAFLAFGIWLHQIGFHDVISDWLKSVIFGCVNC